jgi:hypothetical protein
VSETPPIDTPPAPPVPPPGLPWEEPSAGLGSIFPTALRFITSPIEAFAKMSLTVDLVRPIAYFVAFVLVGVPIGQLWRYVFWTRETSGLDFIPPDVMSQLPWLQVLLDRPTILIVVGLMIIAPLLNLITLFIWSGIVHVFLMMVGGAPKGFATTLRVTCYSQTAGIAVIVPVAGGLIQPVWFLILQIIGLSQAHRVGGGKAAFAVLVPLVVCCGCVVAVVVMSGLAFGNLLRH